MSPTRSMRHEHCWRATDDAQPAGAARLGIGTGITHARWPFSASSESFGKVDDARFCRSRSYLGRHSTRGSLGHQGIDLAHCNLILVGGANREAGAKPEPQPLPDRADEPDHARYCISHNVYYVQIDPGVAGTYLASMSVSLIDGICA